MPKQMRAVITDDHDGKELPDDTQGLSLSIGRTAYVLYLSDKNEKKLRTALAPFIENAEKVGSATPTKRGGSGSGRTKEELAEIRTWAQQQGMDVSDRGRVKKEVLDAWDSK
jgi:hypothetical protein